MEAKHYQLNYNEDYVTPKTVYAVISGPVCGITYINALLNQHDEIEGKREVFYRVRKSLRNREPAKVLKYRNQVFNRSHTMWFYYTKFLTDKDLRDSADSMKKFLFAVARKTNKPIFGFDLPSFITLMSRPTSMNFANSLDKRIIVYRRNLFDAAISLYFYESGMSMKKANAWLNGCANAIDQYECDSMYIDPHQLLLLIERIQKEYQHALSFDGYKYALEDLIANPTKIVTEIQEYLEVENVTPELPLRLDDTLLFNHIENRDEITQIAEDFENDKLSLLSSVEFYAKQGLKGAFIKNRKHLGYS